MHRQALDIVDKLSSANHMTAKEIRTKKKKNLLVFEENSAELSEILEESYYDLEDMEEEQKSNDGSEKHQISENL